MTRNPRSPAPRALRHLRNALLLVVGLVVLGCLALAVGAVVPRPLFASDETAATGTTRQVLLLANPIHTDLAFPADADVVERFGFLEEGGLPVYDPAVRWIFAGWGGRAFYLETPTWAELKPLPLLKGITVDRSVMHTEIAGDIDLTHQAVTVLTVGEDAFQAMLEATLATFERTSKGRPRPIEGSGYGAYDRFYEAKGRFSAILGCNTWTSAVLRAGGLRTGAWTPLPQTLAWSIRRNNPADRFVAQR